MALLSTQIEPPQYLMPAKFLLLMSQILLLTLVLYLRTDHLYTENALGQQTSASEMSTSQLNKAESTLIGVTVCYIIFMAFEFLMQILGVSLHYNQTNILQIFLHILGCTFTLWFILDAWPYASMWPIWVCFGLFPFLLECGTITQAVVFSVNVGKNRRGEFK